MNKGNNAQALQIFKMNVALHPNSGDTYDSLAEIYEHTGDKKQAISNYRRSLELNPKNTNA